MVTIVSSQNVGGTIYYTIQVVGTNSAGQNATQNISGLTASDIYNTYGQIVGGYVPPSGGSNTTATYELATFGNPSVNGSQVIVTWSGSGHYVAAYNGTPILLRLNFSSGVNIDVSSTIQATGQATFNVGSNTGTFTISMLNPSNLSNTYATSVSGTVSASIPTFDTYTVTIQAPNGNQQTFTVKGSDFQSYQSTITPALNVVNNVINHGQTSAPNTVSDITAFLAANPQVTTYSAITLTIKAINGTTQTFTMLLSDWNSFDHSALTVTSQNQFNTQTKPVNVVNDIVNFLTANATGGTTPPPPQPTPAPTVSNPVVIQNNISITYSSVGTSLLITRNGTPLTNPLLSGTLTDSGLANGTYQYSFVAILNGVNSTPTTVTATVNYTAPTQANNYAYNIQIPNVVNALQLITSTNYGTTSQISFPAKAFVQNILNQNVPTIPNTLNALFISQVSTTPNEVTVANALIGYFPATPVQTGPKRSVIEIAGGIFAGLITLSLFTSGNNSKVKRKHA